MTVSWVFIEKMQLLFGTFACIRLKEGSCGYWVSLKMSNIPLLAEEGNAARPMRSREATLVPRRRGGQFGANAAKTISPF